MGNANGAGAIECGPIVKVIWIDIEEHDPCHCPAKNLYPPICESYGILEYQDEHRVVIATEKRGDEIVRQVFPLGCVKSVTWLREI